MSCIYNLESFPLFQGCGIEDFESLEKLVPCRFTSYNKGDIVAIQNEKCKSLMLLCSGSLSAKMIGDEGKEITVEVLKAPEVLAAAFMYSSEDRFPVTLHVEEEVTIWSIAKATFLDLLHDNQTLLLNFIRHISDRSVFLSRKFNEFALLSLTERIISYLNRHRYIHNIQEVSLILGVARPSLSRAITLLIDNGKIKREKDGYCLIE